MNASPKTVERLSYEKPRNVVINLPLAFAPIGTMCDRGIDTLQERDGRVKAAFEEKEASEGFVFMFHLYTFEPNVLCKFSLQDFQCRQIH